MGECRAVLFLEAQTELSWGGVNVRYGWSGGCVNGFIEGNGVLTAEFDMVPQERSSESDHYRFEDTTSASGGLLQGRSSSAAYSNVDDLNESTPAGSMQMLDFGDVRNPMPGWYENGCSHHVKDDGAVSDYINFGCDVTAGPAFLAALGGGASVVQSPTNAGSHTDEVPSDTLGGLNLSDLFGGAIAGNGGMLTTCARTPDETLARFDADFGALTASKTLPSGAGARDTYQYTYYLGVEGLKLMEPYRGCLGPHEAPNDAQLHEMIDAGLKGCAALSVASGTCAAQYPF